MVMTAISVATMVSVDGVEITMMSGVAITIASGVSIDMVTGLGPSTGSLLFTLNRYTSRHRPTTSRDYRRASLCIFR